MDVNNDFYLYKKGSSDVTTDFTFKFAIECHGRLNPLFFPFLFIVWYLHLELAASLLLPFSLFLSFDLLLCRSLSFV